MIAEFGEHVGADLDGAIIANPLWPQHVKQHFALTRGVFAYEVSIVKSVQLPWRRRKLRT